ncbi:CG13670, partial [Drosophila busckii]
CSAVGYSYTRFEGPVVGPERLVTVPEYGADYVARPEYSFAYGVEDGKTRVLQNRKETRSGDEVRGVYSVVDPDGTLRVVKYTADDAHGFQAEVITNGVASLHGHGATDAGAAAVEQQVEHNEVADDEEEEEEEQVPAPYKVHEPQQETEDDAEHEEGGGDEEAEEYEGSSEEGYEDAKQQSQSSEEAAEEY